jgi:hypothetical protein
MPETELIGDNGHSDEDVAETQEQLNVARLKLSNLTRPDGQLVRLSPQQLSLMMRMLAVGSDKYNEQVMWRMCDFLDEEEAKDHVAAFYEAQDLGMDTGFNVAFMFALCSTNRKGNKTNLMSMLTDALHNFKYTDNSRRKKGEYSNPGRSPLDT